MTNNLLTYEKILTLNDESFAVISGCSDVLLSFIKEKCDKDQEHLEYFQLNLTDSENSPFSKNLKIKWAVTSKSE